MLTLLGLLSTRGKEGELAYGMRTATHLYSHRTIPNITPPPTRTRSLTKVRTLVSTRTFSFLVEATSHDTEKKTWYVQQCL